MGLKQNLGGYRLSRRKYGDITLLGRLYMKPTNENLNFTKYADINVSVFQVVII